MNNKENEKLREQLQNLADAVAVLYSATMDYRKERFMKAARKYARSELYRANEHLKRPITFDEFEEPNAPGETN